MTQTETHLEYPFEYGRRLKGPSVRASVGASSSRADGWRLN